MDREEIESFLFGRLEVAERKRLLRHLGSCVPCRRLLREQADLLLGDEPWLAAEPAADERYDEAIAQALGAARGLEKRWRKEQEKVTQALTLLEQAPGGLGDERFPWRQARALHGWPLCEALLRKSYELRFNDPKKMLSLAESAARVAKHIKSEKYPWPGLLADLRARALADLGNALRVNERLAESAATFEQALEQLEQGSGDLLLHARVLDLFASLKRVQRRLDEAVALLEQVHGLYLDAGDRHLAGRALISQGFSVHYQGHPREAVALFQQGAGLLETGRDSQLERSTSLSLVCALADCGEYRQASLILLQSGLRPAFAAEPLNLLKLRWVEGKIHAGLDRPAKAERAFVDVRREYLQRDQLYDASLVGLELAALWLPQGKAAQVRELAEEMHDALAELGVHSEAARALGFVREACLLQAVTVTMIERVRGFLERLPWTPGLRFEPARFAP